MTSTWGTFGIPVVDIDTHWTEPPDLWTARAPQKYKSLVPRIRRDADGNDVWIVDEDISFGPLGSSVIREDGSKVRGITGLTRFEEVDRAAWDPQARLAKMDELGLYAQLVYPNVTGFGSNNFMRIKNNELRLLCAQLYNDAAADFQRAGAGRIFPQAVVPFWDIAAATQEVRRSKADLGLTGITMCDKPEAFGLPYLNEPAWDPFWATCQELGVPVNFHIGAGNVKETINRSVWKGYSFERLLALSSVVLFLDNFRVIINLIFSGLLERYPELKFVSVESGIGWLPFVLEACEYQFDESVPTDREGLSLRPKEYFRRQIYASFWFEDFGPRHAIEYIGEDNVMFETDFPHPTCLYPESQAHITRVLADLNPRVRRKVLRDTAVQLYHLPVPE